LIQTEDLGRTYSTRPVAPQAEFDNARRWMTWDLLAGAVAPGHRLWERLTDFGFGERLRRMADAPCPSDVLGVNHYVTSDRFLDHRTGAYPPERVGGNAFMAYADVEAVRVLLPAPDGLAGALQEAWARYGRPLAVTESHNGCTREEQVRWVREAWETAKALRQRGVEVEAVTAWALLGSFDWNSLLTRPVGHYEPGAFDVRGATPRPTALAQELARIGHGERQPPHPATLGPGWWRRDIRLGFQPVLRTLERPDARPAWRADAPPAQPLLITGATGTLGKALARACEWRGLDYRLTSRREMALDDAGAIRRTLDAAQPWAVINAAGFVRVDDAEADAAACMAANAEGALELARACAERGLPFVGVSTDLVFDGRQARPYVESDAVSPLNVYGASKARLERDVLELGGKPLIVRTAAFFSPHDPYNFAVHVVRTLAQDLEFIAANDLVVSPTFVPDLVEHLLDLLIDGETGIRHLSNEGEVSWAEFARLVANATDRDADLVKGVPARNFGWAAARPSYVPLASERGRVMPSLDHAVARFAEHIRQEELEAGAHSETPVRREIRRRVRVG
jgi:dTDP-4-dehydrorhamnose reductase